MVVLSAAICTRSGKALLARQYVEMPRMRVEALLAQFPKLVSPNKLSTMVESDSCRFCFLPLDALYLVLITTKQSNIVDDVESLKLLAKVVADTCPLPTEEAVGEVAFELVAAFDEVILVGGAREAINLQGIKSALEMQSHEEALSKLLRVQKENDAKHAMKKAAAGLEKSKQGGGMGGGNNFGRAQGFGSSSSEPYRPAEPIKPVTPTPAPVAKPAAGGAAGKKGLQLSKKKRGEDLLEALAGEEGMDVAEANIASANTPLAAPGAVAVPKDPITVGITEQVSCTLKQDGTLEEYSVSGQIQIVSRLPDQKYVIKLERAPDALDKFAFKTHPHLDKAAWESSGILALKAADRTFEANTPFNALKYPSKPIKEASEVPLTVTVWPELTKGGKVINVNMEYELLIPDYSLFNLTFTIPLGSNEVPEVVAVEGGGSYRHNSRRQQLEWTVDLVSDSTSSSGSMEFNLPNPSGKPFSPDTAFFPTIVNFTANKSLAGLLVASVTDAEGQEVRFGTDVLVQTAAERYQVVAE